MKKILLLAFILVFLIPLKAQISTDPGIPTANAAVTITFNAAGTGLAGYTGDVYAHTGVTIEGVGRWQHVIETWGNNTTQPKLTNIGTGLYKLEITPSINEYYGVTAGENVTELCFVFRSADATSQTSDIFVNVYEVGLAISITDPIVQPYFVDASSTFNIHIEGTQSISTSVKIDNSTVHTETTAPNSFDYVVNTEASGLHEIIVEATDGAETVADTFKYNIRSIPAVESLPAGVRDGINYIDDNTVTLVLHAPYKNSVYAFGSFNDWQPLAMNKTVADINDPELRYWITISSLITNKEYLFQYIVDENLKIADPYSEKISDPWNDKYINNETYPNLISYPPDITEGIVSTFQTAQTPYNWQVTDFSVPKKDDLVVYELLVRDFTEKANYQTLIDTIGYFKKLGINAIELMPTNEFEGNDSWGYNPSFYFAPDKAYGTKNKMKEFIDVCHQNGIAVFIDLVLNHSYGLSPFVQLYFDKSTNKPTAQNLWYNVDHNFQNPDAHWGYDFNHDSQYTRELVDSINSFWLNIYKVDGFRFDFTKGFSNTIYGPSDWGSAYDASRIANLKRMADEIWLRKPEAYVSFEHLSDNSEETELANYGIYLWGNMNGKYNEATMGYNESSKSDLSWGSYKQRGWTNPNLLTYMESHDEERLMYKNLLYGNADGTYNIKEYGTALARIEMAACFFFTIPGPKMIWQFGELGYDISIDENGRVGKKPILWDYYDSNNRYRLFQIFSALINLKQEHDVFETTDYTINVTGATKSINLTGSDMNVTIIGNFDVVAAEINPNFQQTGTWYDYFSGESISVTDVNANIALVPGEYHIYTTVQLAKPDITDPSTGIFEVKKNSSEQIGLKTYPNPATELVNIEFILEKQLENAEISVYNIHGQKVNTIYHGNLSKGQHKLEWQLNGAQGNKISKGLYLIKVSDGKLNNNSVVIVK